MVSYNMLFKVSTITIPFHVAEVGLRSTKIRTLEGHLVTVPNGELANKTIQNIGKRPYISRIVDLTITYDTPSEKIDLALEIVKEILDDHEGMNDEFPPTRVFQQIQRNIPKHHGNLLVSST